MEGSVIAWIYNNLCLWLLYVFEYTLFYKWQQQNNDDGDE